jgi:hypothetical protein
MENNKIDNYKLVKKEIEKTYLRLDTIRRDYQRDNSNVSTTLVCDTCDLIVYSNISEETSWENLTTKQRIVKNLFENEIYPRVLFPYHAYEYIKYTFNILEKLHLMSSGLMSVSDLLDSSPALSQFFKAFHQGNYDEAAKIWESNLLNSFLSLVIKNDDHANRLMIQPIRKIVRLIDNKQLLAISDILKLKVDPSLINYSIYSKVLGKLESELSRHDLFINNDLDALTAGLAKGLNDIQSDYYFSLSTLATVPLTAYSRSSLEDERTSFCRNTCVSSYRVNINKIYPHNVEARMKYVSDSMEETQALIKRFDSLINAPPLVDFSLSGKYSAEIITSIGLLAEYYYNVYNKIVSPVKSSLIEEEQKHGFWHFAETLSDENAAIEGFNVAVKQMINDVRIFTEKLREFTLSSKEFEVGGQKLETEIDNILSNIEDIDKQSR